VQNMRKVQGRAQYTLSIPRLLASSLSKFTQVYEGLSGSLQDFTLLFHPSPQLF
jgi:hypothetical protein